MKLSQRISSVGASATIAITARVSQLQAQGLDVVGLGAGEPDFDTPQFIKDAAVAAMQQGDTKYTPRTGKALLAAIVDKLARENALRVEPSQVVVTFGCKHALYTACQALVDPGDRVLIPAPYWVSCPEIVKLAGGEPVILPTRYEDSFKVSPRQVLDAAGDAKILLISYPSNPTGVTYTRDELTALADAVLQTDLIVFSDETYERLVFGDAEFTSFATLDDRLLHRTLTFNSLSKTFSMPGWRLGWVAGPENVIDAMRRIMSHQTTNPVSFAQAGALAAYTNPQSPAVCEQMRQEFEKRGKHIARRLNAIDGIRCIKPQGAFYVFPDVSAHYGRTLGGVEVADSLTFAKAALESAKVAVVPGAPFGEDRCVRLSFATSMEQIDKGLDRLEDLLA